MRPNLAIALVRGASLTRISAIVSSMPYADIKDAIDFVRKKNRHVESHDTLPYDNLLVPLTVFAR